MTREEAIANLEESKRQNKIMRDNPSTFWASHQMENGVKNTVKRIAALDIALSALRPVSREQVEKVWRGEWDSNGPRDIVVYCKQCMMPQDIDTNFCHSCGAAMTDEAVETTMRRLEAIFR